MLNEIYLESAKNEFLNYKMLAEKAMAQLQPADLFFQPNEASNSIALIIQHMAGNMLSRWTDFLISDGEKEWRDRDAEFRTLLTDATSLMQKWNEGWNCLFTTLDNLRPTQLEDIVLIRNEKHSVVQAINRQLAHYPYHVGQIVFIAKQIKGNEFSSLSIEKNKSKEFN